MAALRDAADAVRRATSSTRTDFDSRFCCAASTSPAARRKARRSIACSAPSGAAFGVASAVAPAGGGRGKAYFIERLLKSVMFQESGLAGVNRRLQLLKLAAQSTAYVACAAVLVLGALALAVSYKANASYIGGSRRCDDVAGSPRSSAPARRHCHPKRCCRGSTRCEPLRQPRTILRQTFRGACAWACIEATRSAKPPTTRGSVSSMACCCRCWRRGLRNRCARASRRRTGSMST